jgi:segregation and condensation protein B
LRVAEANLAQKVTALLFVATEPLPAARLAEHTGATEAQLQAAVEELRTPLQSAGLTISEFDNKYRLVTSPGTSPTVRRFLQEEAKNDLTRPALETLAIVAYRGPITKTGIEQIRGVASEIMLRNLLARGLIAEAGKSSEPGRPMRYGVSQTFLEHFGLTSPRDLPAIPEAPVEN